MKRHIVLLTIALLCAGLCSAQGIKFGLVADPQYSTDANSGVRYYNSSLIRLQQATDTFQIHSMPFIAVLGDFINAYTATDTLKALKDYDSINTRLTRYSGERYAVIGNHDCVSTSKPEFMVRIACRIPQNYYSFDKGNYHFIVLDCEYNPDSTDFGHNNFTWNNALIPAREKQWLISDLAAAGSKSVFVFMHNVCDSTKSGEQILNNAEIRSVFETAGNVKAVFSGHKHTGGYWSSNGIHYLTMKGMVEQALPGNAFSEVTITAAGDSMIIKGYSNQPSFKLKLKTTVAIAAPETNRNNSITTDCRLPAAKKTTTKYTLRGQLIKNNTLHNQIQVQKP